MSPFLADPQHRSSFFRSREEESSGKRGAFLLNPLPRAYGQGPSQANRRVAPPTGGNDGFGPRRFFER